MSRASGIWSGPRVGEIGPLHCPCGGEHFEPVFTYTAPPPGEVAFRFSAGVEYRREVSRCRLCGHFVSRHGMQAEGIYAGEYVNATYRDDGIRRAFERIVGLDPSRSDNAGRVRRILDFAARHFQPATGD